MDNLSERELSLLVDSLIIAGTHIASEKEALKAIEKTIAACKKENPNYTLQCWEAYLKGCISMGGAMARGDKGGHLDAMIITGTVAKIIMDTRKEIESLAKLGKEKTDENTGI